MFKKGILSGGAERDRTPDLMTARQNWAFCQDYEIT